MSNEAEANGIDQTLLFQKPMRPRKEPLLLYFGHPISEKKLRKETERCARALFRWGIKPGSAVFLCQTQTPELLYSLLAIWQLGAVAHLLHPDAPLNALRDCISTAKGELLLLSDVYAQRFAGILSQESSVQTVLVPLTHSISLLQQARLRGTLPIPPASISSPRLLLWKEFIESGKSICAVDASPLPPDAAAAVYYPSLRPASARIMKHRQICDATRQLCHGLPTSQKGAFLLSQQRPWQAEALPALLLPFCSDLCLLLEPRNSDSELLSTLLTNQLDYLHCDRSYCLWLQEQGLASAALSHLSLLHPEPFA